MIITVDTGEQIDWSAVGADQIKNNVLNIMRTRLGEIPYMPNLGLSPDYIGKPVAQARAALMADMRAQLKRYAPSAQLQDLIITPDENGDYSIKVVITL